jgi:hypothetical protein
MSATFGEKYATADFICKTENDLTTMSSIIKNTFHNSLIKRTSPTTFTVTFGADNWESLFNIYLQLQQLLKPVLE